MSWQLVGHDTLDMPVSSQPSNMRMPQESDVKHLGKNTELLFGCSYCVLPVLFYFYREAVKRIKLSRRKSE